METLKYIFSFSFLRGKLCESNGNYIYDGNAINIDNCGWRKGSYKKEKERKGISIHLTTERKRERRDLLDVLVTHFLNEDSCKDLNLTATREMPESTSAEAE